MVLDVAYDVEIFAFFGRDCFPLSKNQAQCGWKHLRFDLYEDLRRLQCNVST